MAADLFPVPPEIVKKFTCLIHRIRPEALPQVAVEQAFQPDGRRHRRSVSLESLTYMKVALARHLLNLAPALAGQHGLIIGPAGESGNFP